LGIEGIHGLGCGRVARYVAGPMQQAVRDALLAAEIEQAELRLGEQCLRRHAPSLARSFELAQDRLQRYKVPIQNAQLAENIPHYLQLVSFQAAGSMKPISGEFPEFPAPPKNFPAPARKIPAAARKIPCSAQQGICCKSLEMQRQLIPKPPTLHRIRKNSLLNSWGAPLL
jgi:hypothetical protein